MGKFTLKIQNDIIKIKSTYPKEKFSFSTDILSINHIYIKNDSFTIILNEGSTHYFPVVLHEKNIAIFKENNIDIKVEK